ncbi:MAG: hypothetical protein IPI16_19365 [Comamonadaceae bacterium]|nr:hypothetical protein [Comamonadaceae bacterium]
MKLACLARVLKSELINAMFFFRLRSAHHAGERWAHYDVPTEIGYDFNIAAPVLRLLPRSKRDCSPKP